MLSDRCIGYFGCIFLKDCNPAIWNLTPSCEIGPIHFIHCNSVQVTMLCCIQMLYKCSWYITCWPSQHVHNSQKERLRKYWWCFYFNLHANSTCSSLKKQISIFARWLVSQHLCSSHTLCPCSLLVFLSVQVFETYWHRNYVGGGTIASSLLQFVFPTSHQ